MTICGTGFPGKARKTSILVHLMNISQLSILFIGFDDEDAKRIALHFRTGEKPPILECVEPNVELSGIYRATSPDLVFVHQSGNDLHLTRDVLAGLEAVRLTGLVNCKFVVLETGLDHFEMQRLYKYGADAVVPRVDIEKLGRDYLRQVAENGDKDSLTSRAQSTGSVQQDTSADNGEAGPADFGNRLLEQQVQSQRLETIGTLAGGIAHDFNNILAAIMGFAHSALLDVDEESGTANDLNRIVGAAERAASLTSQIMAFGRRRKLHNELVNFTETVSAGLEMSRGAIPSNVIFRTELDDNIGLVRADPTQWQQVVLNLCLNSAQAMDERGGTIKIRLRRVSVDRTIRRGSGAAVHGDTAPGEYNELAISDNGNGMSDDVRQRIFEPFYTSRKPGKGTGLGMAVVHGIVSNHLGTISVESDVGSGSKVTILIPCATEMKIPTRERESRGQVSGGDERILFVDDEVDIGLAYATPLRRLGYDVTVCESGVEALELHRANPARFDLIITDQIMPELSGSELAKKVAADGDRTPVMICSGYHTEKISELRDVPNVCDVLRKPISPKKMGEAIRAIMDGKVDAPASKSALTPQH